MNGADANTSPITTSEPGTPTGSSQVNKDCTKIKIFSNL
jgi:hypothetical protein